MVRLMDTSLWISAVRSPQHSGVIHPLLASNEAVLCEPVLYELFRGATRRQEPLLNNLTSTVPVLATPKSLWQDATRLGKKCRARNIHPSAMDLLIATIALAHGATLVSLDGDFTKLAKVGGFEFERVKLRG